MTRNEEFVTTKTQFFCASLLHFWSGQLFDEWWSSCGFGLFSGRRTSWSWISELVVRCSRILVNSDRLAPGCLSYKRARPHCRYQVLGWWISTSIEMCFCSPLMKFYTSCSLLRKEARVDNCLNRRMSSSMERFWYSLDNFPSLFERIGDPNLRWQGFPSEIRAVAFQL